MRILIALFALAAIQALAGTDPSPLPSPLVIEPAQALSLWAFMKAHWSEIGGAVFTILFAFSEYLAQSEKFKANSIFQLIQGWLKGRAGQ